MNNIKKKWLLSIAFILVMSLAIVGCTNDTNDTDDTQTGDPDTEEKLDDATDDVEDAADDAKDTVDDTVKDVEDDVRDMTYDDIKVTPEEAFDKFMELHPNTKVKSVDLDKEVMEYQYVVEGYDENNEYEVKMNPVDGEVISDDSDDLDMDDDDDDGEITKDHLSKVDSIIDKAKKEDGSDSELDEWDISIEDGKVVIDVEIGATEYSYDMETEELIEKDM